MAIQIIGYNTNRQVDIDSNRNIRFRRGTPGVTTSSLGGSFLVTGGPSNFVTASIASATMLMSLRHHPTASTTIFISQINFTYNVSTTGSSANTPGQIAWQRFTSATPTGGTARTPARLDTSIGSATQVADVRDHSASLTTAGVVTTDILLDYPVVNYTVGPSAKMDTFLGEDEMIRLAAGDGLALVMNVAGPAVETWTYTYAIHYTEE